MAIILGIQPDVPVVENQNGGKQSDTPYSFHMVPASAAFAAAKVCGYGANKYGETFENRNYTKIPAVEHVNHAIQHLYGYLAGDKSDDHLAHAIVRCMFAYDVDCSEKSIQGNDIDGDTDVEPTGNCMYCGSADIIDTFDEVRCNDCGRRFKRFVEFDPPAANEGE